MLLYFIIYSKHYTNSCIYQSYKCKQCKHTINFKDTKFCCTFCHSHWNQYVYINYVDVVIYVIMKHGQYRAFPEFVDVSEVLCHLQIYLLKFGY